MQAINVRGRFLLIVVVTLLAVWLYHSRGLKLAQDLRGGTSVRFSIDVERAKAEGRVAADESLASVMKHTLDVISDRVNRSGLQEIEIVPLGENKFEINLPASSEGETDSIIELVTTLGDLQFRIEVLPQYHDDNEAEHPRTRTKVWTGTTEEFETYKKAEVERYETAQASGRAYKPSRAPYRVVPVQRRGSRLASGEFAVLEDPEDPAERFDGGIIGSVSLGKGEDGVPVTLFTVKNEYRGAFQRWTSRNVGLPMVIVLNGMYTTAPRINSPLSDNVQVTLGTRDWGEAKRQAEELQTTLQTGSLKIHPEQESKTKLGARLAGESRDRGLWATVTSLLLVLLFMLVYYRWMGAVANLALVLNLVLLLGAMAAFGAALSLPGIAGIVLTLGAAVDANILINERIREERLLGRTVPRAIAEGYGRALTTIVDANMTTVITALFLYVYGSGSIRGFAVSLTLGLAISMFTAVFVTRTVFEWQLKRGSLREVSALGHRTTPRVRWMALRRILVPISVAGIVLGLIGFFSVDRFALYDIDFTGGQKVQMGFASELDVAGVKARLRGEPVAVEVATTVKDADGQNVARRRRVLAGPYPDAEVYAVRSEGHKVELKVQRVSSSQDDLTADEEVQALKGFLRARFADVLLPAWISGPPTPFTYTAPTASPGAPATGLDPLAPGAAADGDRELAAVSGGWAFDLSFVDGAGVLTTEVLRDLLKDAFPASRVEGSGRRTLPPSAVQREVVVRPAPQVQPGVRSFLVWLKTTAAGGDAGSPSESVDPREPRELQDFLGAWLGGAGFKTALSGRLKGAPQADEVELALAFPSEDQISTSVAEQLRDAALIALLLSFLGIVVYVAVRFRSRSMGIASVLCLFHDVSIALGAVALVNALGLVDAKINLTMVAALLTLVGLSINDTVVVYDRIRENRGKRPTITADVIDTSINQTLSRTLRTTATILIVCGTLFGFNLGQRNVLEGFSFCLIVGLLVGTYSSIAIASPLLLYLPWIWEKVRAQAPSGRLVALCATHWSLALVLPIALLLWAAWGLVFCLYAFVVGLLLFTPWALRGDAPTQAQAG